jgi:hypothetical protein
MRKPMMLPLVPHRLPCHVLAAALAFVVPLALAQAPATPPLPAPAAGGTTPAASSPAMGGTAPATAAPATGSTTPPAAPAEALASLEWLSGCWRGAVNQREFREQWLPAAGGMMIGAGHTVLQGRTQDYEYLRLEARSDGLYYVALPSGQKETSFRLAGTAHDEASGAEIWTFANVAEGFPQRIVYRRGAEGWLYAGVEGSLNGEERKVLYPMRHIGCESGELIRK